MDTLDAGNVLRPEDAMSLADWDSGKLASEDGATVCEATEQNGDRGIGVDSPVHLSPPFELRADLNQKLCVWCGDISLLQVDAIVNCTNESLTDFGPTSSLILQRAGPELLHELRTNVKTCKTGFAVATKGYRLPARFVFHTVGPTFKFKFQTAATSALYSCYRCVVHLAREMGVRTIAISCIHSPRRGYPALDGAHVALRTLRRHLEHFSSEFDRIVLVLTDHEEVVYARLLPLYFPRTEADLQRQLSELPVDLGNEFGEPTPKERQIRISSMPRLMKENGYSDDDEEANTVLVQTAVRCPAENSRAVAQGLATRLNDPDQQFKTRAQQQKRTSFAADAAMSPSLPAVSQTAADRAQAYDRLRLLAKRTNHSAFNESGCFYRSGFDNLGRLILVFVARNFPFRIDDDSTNWQRVLLYLISVMDSAVNQDYVVVYVHTGTSGNQQLPVSFLRLVQESVDRRYGERLRALYMVHPSVWSRMIMWYFGTFGSSGIKDKVVTVKSLSQLWSTIKPDQLDLPAFVVSYDAQQAPSATTHTPS